MPDTPQFFYFDLGNVLLLFDHEIACRQMAALSGITADRVREIVFQSGLEDRYECGDVTNRDFYEIFCEQSKTRPDYDELLLASSAIFQLNVPIVPVVAHLRGAGYRTGILSNTCDSHWRYVSQGRYAIVTEFFDVYALSFELHGMKPARDIYIAAADLAGFKPSEIFFVDDRPDNVAGALAAGYDAVQFTSAVDLARQLRSRNVRMNL